MSSERTLQRKRRKQIEKEVDELVDYIKANKASTVAGAGLAEISNHQLLPSSGRMGSGQGASLGQPSGRGRMTGGFGLRKVYFRLGPITFPIGITKSSIETVVFNRVLKRLDREGIYCRRCDVKFEDDCEKDEERVELDIA